MLILNLQGRGYWGGRGGRGHPNVFTKFENFIMNPEKIDNFGCLATPKFCSSGFGHRIDIALATSLSLTLHWPNVHQDGVLSNSKCNCQSNKFYFNRDIQIFPLKCSKIKEHIFKKFQIWEWNRIKQCYLERTLS